MNLPQKIMFCLAGWWLAATAYGQTEAPGKRNATLQKRYAQALQLYRQNEAAEALSILADLHRRVPKEKYYLYDYLAIASWNGNQELAISLSKELDPKIAPAYVYETLAQSYRQLKSYDQALATYAIVIKRYPKRVESLVGRIHVLIDTQRLQEAEAELAPLRSEFPGRKEVWEASVRLSDAQAQPLRMLAEAERVLKSDPDDRFALRMRFFALRKAGAVHLALQLTPSSVLNPMELLMAKRDQLAAELRWARISADDLTQTERWAKMDAVIAGLQMQCRVNLLDGNEPVPLQGMCMDLVVALADRQRPAEAVAVYEKLQEKKWPIPAYVHFYAAASYLQQRMPEKARDIYAAVLPQTPSSQDAQIGYVYSLLECEQYDAAYRQADKLAADSKEWLNPQSPAIRQANYAYPRAQILSALIRSYTDRLAEGQAGLEQLARRAPHNTDIRQTLAMTYGMRGWHHLAEEEAVWLAAAEPSNVNLQLRLFENRKALGDYRGADRSLKTALRLMPDEPAVRKAQREWNVHQLYEMRVEARYGQSSGGLIGTSQNGNRESQLDARLFSAPYAYDWRYFAHTQWSSATFPGAYVAKPAVGGGAEYRVRDLTVTGEVLNIGQLGAGLSLGSDYRLDDRWSLNGLAESNSLSAPIRAYAANVRAKNLQFGTTYRWHESRALSVVVNQMGFTDGNLRRALDMAWTERLLTAPVYKLDATLEYYTSRNSSQSAAISYFNPARDGFVGASFRGEWVQYHRYEKSLKHVVRAALGNYSQQNYASGSVSTLQYEQVLQTTDRLELRYGLGRTAHPYDGQRVTTNFLNLSANWMF